MAERPGGYPGLSETELKNLECVKGTEVKELLEERRRWEEEDRHWGTLEGGWGRDKRYDERVAIIADYCFHSP